MQTQTQSLTIFTALTHTFEAHPYDKFFNQIYPDKFNLYVIEREDKNLSYVTDGFHTILALAPKMKQEINIHPTNVLNNRFYLFQEKTYLYLNFKQVTDPPEPHLMHPYTPHHYFRERYEQFVKVRQTLKLPNPCQQITLLKWQIVLVNVNAEGYYAPALILHQFKKSWSKSTPQYNKISCILYEKKIQRYMENYRINDLRQFYSKTKPKNFEVSLFYFARNKIVPQSKGEGSLIVCFDKDKQILNYKDERPCNIILASHELEGLCSFIDNNKNIITEEDSSKIQQKQLIDLFNGLNLNSEKKAMMNQQEDQKQGYDEQRGNMLWADTSSEQSGQQEQRVQKIQAELEQNDSEQSEEDPLKKLYMKYIQRQKKMI